MDFMQLIGSIVSIGGPFSVIRAILGFILVFFLPGFAWTLVFFRRINAIERIALSFGISIAVVTLSIFALNVLFRIGINAVNSLLTIAVITVIALLLYLIKRLGNGQKPEPDGD